MRLNSRPLFTLSLSPGSLPSGQIQVPRPDLFPKRKLRDLSAETQDSDKGPCSHPQAQGSRSRAETQAALRLQISCPGQTLDHGIQT